LATKAPPVMEYAKFDGSRLKIKVSQPFIVGRAESVVFINRDMNDPIKNGLPHCVYPISSFIHKEVEYCRDIFSIDMPWEDARRCYWNTTEQSAFQVWRGQIMVRSQEWTSVSTWRTIQSKLRIAIKFKRFASVESTITAYNEPSLVYAITKQIVNIDRNEPARVEVVSVLNWPYKLNPDLSNWDTAVVPNNPDNSPKYSSIDKVVVDCDATYKETEKCKQRWNNYLHLLQSTCTLTGVYSLNYSLTCAAGASNEKCPLTQKDKKVSIVYSLTSEDFCAEIEVDIGLTATIKSFEDDKLTIPRTSFTVDKKGYFLTTVVSEVSSVKFSSIVVSKVQFVLKSDGAPAAGIQIYNNGPTKDCVDNKCDITIITREKTDEAGFGFVVTKTLIDLAGEASAGSSKLKQNSKITYSLNVFLKVFYLDSAVSGKRALMGVLGEAASSTASSQAEVDLPIEAATESTTKNNAISFMISALLLIIALLF